MRSFYFFLKIHSLYPKSFKCYKTLNIYSKFFSASSSNIDMESNVFRGCGDVHKGVYVKSSDEPCPIADLPKKLKDSLEKWKKENIRAVWFNVCLQDGEWIPILSKNGFRVHRGSGEEIHLVKWLPQHEESRVPAFAHTMIGAGAVVINNKGQVLVVMQQYRDIKYWKLPGGYVEPGEDIISAVQREVLEETNIRTEFVSVVSFRHTIESIFGCSDIYFVVELKPLNEDIKIEALEVDASQWMNIEEYLDHPMVHENNRLFLRKCLFSREKNILIDRETTYHPITKKAQALFFVSTKVQI